MACPSVVGLIELGRVAAVEMQQGPGNSTEAVRLPEHIFLSRLVVYRPFPGLVIQLPSIEAAESVVAN